MITSYINMSYLRKYRLLLYQNKYNSSSVQADFVQVLLEF